MDEQNVVIEANAATETEQTETAKTEPAKTERPVSTAEVDKLKAALSKANSEAAEYKRQLREKQTAAEREAAERAEQEQAMRAELETLRKEKAVADYTNRALEVGFDTETAAQAANAMADGDMSAVFEALRAFVEATKTRLENEALNRQPGLSTGTAPTTNTVDAETAQLRKWMGLK